MIFQEKNNIISEHLWGEEIKILRVKNNQCSRKKTKINLVKKESNEFIYEELEDIIQEKRCKPNFESKNLVIQYIMMINGLEIIFSKYITCPMKRKIF